MTEPSPFIPPLPGLGPSPRASPRAGASVIPQAMDPNYHYQASSRVGRTPYRFEGMPPQASYESSPASYFGQPPPPQSRSRPSSMYGAPAPAMSRGNSGTGGGGGLYPNGYPTQGYYDVPHGTPYHAYAGRSRSHSRPQPPELGMDFSQPSMHSRPHSHSRNYSDSYPRPGAVPDQFVRLGVPADSPWYPPQMPPAGYENVGFGHEPPRVSPTYPSPGYGPGPGYGAYADYSAPAHYGQPQPYHRARSHSMRGSERSTPWLGGGYLPPMTPGGHSDQLPDHLAEDYGIRVARPERGRMGNIDTRWMAGRGYGPVLDPLHASIVRATFKINPLLGPPPSGESSERPYLTWNMLFSSSHTHRSDERINQSWMKDRNAPATFPRLSSLRIIAKKIPWFVDVEATNASVGVTCGDVIDTLSDFLHEFTRSDDYDALRSKVAQDAVRAAYYLNRSMEEGVPGGRIGKGMRRMDFLGQDTVWGGLEVNERYVKERLALHGNKREASCIFVLKCERRLALTEEEARAERLRAEEDDD